MKKLSLILPVLAALLMATGCAADRAVSVETNNLASALVQVSEDFQKDSARYLTKFEADASAKLAVAEARTIELIKKNAGSDVDKKVEAVKKVFEARREKLKENIVKARVAYRERVVVLQLSADMVIAIDDYHRTRLYQPWKSLGSGLTSGVFSKISVIVGMVDKIANNPVIVEN